LKFIPTLITPYWHKHYDLPTGISIIFTKRSACMKMISKISLMAAMVLLVSCGGSSKAKRGCPANDSNLGAERVMAGEGKKKPTKFKVKGMDKPYYQ
jgi:hypothetical protein